MNSWISLGWVRRGLAAIAIGGIACSSATSTTDDALTRALRVSAQTTIALRDTVPQLSTSVTVTNDGAGPVHLEYGACAVRVLAFRDQARSGNPVWNSDYRKPYHASYGYGCTLQLIVNDLQSGGSLNFGFRGPPIELVGDSLPDGRYYLAADLMLSKSPKFMRIPAGSVDVSLPRAR